MFPYLQAVGKKKINRVNRKGIPLTLANVREKNHTLSLYLWLKMITSFDMWMIFDYCEGKIFCLKVFNICKPERRRQYCPEAPLSYRRTEPFIESIKEITEKISFLSLCPNSGSLRRTHALILPIKLMNMLENITESSSQAKTQQYPLPTFIFVLVRLDSSLSDLSLIWKQLTILY